MTFPTLVICVLSIFLTNQAFAKVSFLPEKNNQVALYLKEKPLNIQKEWLNTQLSHIQMTPKVLELIQKPSEDKPWYRYKNHFIQPNRIKNGHAFREQHHAYLKEISLKYGVPKEIIVAIMGVETNYGKHKGQFVAIDAISTLAFYYPLRHTYFKSEFTALLKLAHEQKWDLRKIKGSYAGALGIPQFMPSSYTSYALSHKGKQPNLLYSEKDSIISIAHYLKKRGKWEPEKPIIQQLKLNQKQHIALTRIMKNKEITSVSSSLKKQLTQLKIKEAKIKDPLWLVKFEEKNNTSIYALAYSNFKSIMSYNNSHKYAYAVYQLSKAIKNKM